MYVMYVSLHIYPSGDHWAFMRYRLIIFSWVCYFGRYHYIRCSFRIFSLSLRTPSLIHLYEMILSRPLGLCSLPSLFFSVTEVHISVGCIQIFVNSNAVIASLSEFYISFHCGQPQDLFPFYKLFFLIIIKYKLFTLYPAQFYLLILLKYHHYLDSLPWLFNHFADVA